MKSTRIILLNLLACLVSTGCVAFPIGGGIVSTPLTKAALTNTTNEAAFWGGTQTNSPYAAEYGTVEWSDGTNTVYVPMLSDKTTPATNDVSGMSVVQTNFAGYAHNAGPYSLIFGGATNTYANLLTNSVNIATNAAGLITEVWE